MRGYLPNKNMLKPFETYPTTLIKEIAEIKGKFLANELNIDQALILSARAAVESVQEMIADSKEEK